jgi:large subunit ribosomal protein L21
MYAVIKTGGKQYRVAPGDTLRIEKAEHNDGAIEFSEIVAVSLNEGKFESDLSGAKVVAEVVSEGRGDKLLVFHYKRKKQYKKLQGHRQSFVEVKIKEIFVGNFTYDSAAEHHPAKHHAAKQSIVKHTAAKHTAVKHTEAKHTEAKHVEAKHTETKHEETKHHEAKHDDAE